MKMPDIFESLPQALLHEMLFAAEADMLREIHLRPGRRTEILCGRSTLLLRHRATQQDLTVLLEAAAERSLYAAQEYLREGFFTTRDGCRVGIVGRVVRENGGVRAIRDLCGLNLRIAREVRGAAGQAVEALRLLPASVLIVGSPGCGKTTLLRDLIRQISDGLGQRVGVADTRFELGAVVQGVPQLDLGERTDILSGGEKEESMMLLLRTMNPQWIAVDEISTAADVAAMERCVGCGVHLLATAHAFDRGDLERRPVYRAMLEAGIFRHLIEMAPDGSFRMGPAEYADG